MELLLVWLNDLRGVRGAEVERFTCSQKVPPPPMLCGQPQLARRKQANTTRLTENNCEHYLFVKPRGTLGSSGIIIPIAIVQTRVGERRWPNYDS